MQLNIILMLIFAVIIALFAIMNAAVVTVSFLVTEVEVSLALVIIISALFGAIVVILFDSFKKIKTNKQIKDLNKKVTDSEVQKQAKEKELEALKAQLEEKNQMIEEFKAKDQIVTNQE